MLVFIDAQIGQLLRQPDLALQHRQLDIQIGKGRFLVIALSGRDNQAQQREHAGADLGAEHVLFCLRKLTQGDVPVLHHVSDLLLDDELSLFQSYYL